MQANDPSLPKYELQVERQVPIPMKDGTILRADVYRPTAPGRFPVLVERVAYELTQRCRYTGEYYASRGYVVVGQNVRGRFASEGVFAPFRDDGWGDRRDGYDTILWAGKQPWSNGTLMTSAIPKTGPTGGRSTSRGIFVRWTCRSCIWGAGLTAFWTVLFAASRAFKTRE